MVKQLAPHQIESLKKQFQIFDTDNSGFLEKNELKEAIQKSSFDMPEQEIDEIIKNLDLAKNGVINYSEFLSATIDINSILTQQKMQALFRTFDIDNTGQISPENIRIAFTKFGKEVTDEEIAEIMKEHDTSKGNSITQAEFVAMFG